MLEDNDDGFVCWEIIEPYVNASLDVELSDEVILELLKEMLKQNLISHFVLEDDEYRPCSGVVSVSSWFNATKEGIKAYNQRINADQ